MKKKVILLLLAFMAISAQAITVVNKTKNTVTVKLREGKEIRPNGDGEIKYEPIRKVPLSVEVKSGARANINIDPCIRLYFDTPPIKMRYKGVFGWSTESVALSGHFTFSGKIANDRELHIIDHAAQVKRLEIAIRKASHSRSFLKMRMEFLKNESPDMVYFVFCDSRGEMMPPGRELY